MYRWQLQSMQNTVPGGRSIHNSGQYLQSAMQQSGHRLAHLSQTMVQSNTGEGTQIQFIEARPGFHPVIVQVAPQSQFFSRSKGNYLLRLIKACWVFAPKVGLRFSIRKEVLVHTRLRRILLFSNNKLEEHYWLSSLVITWSLFLRPWQLFVTKLRNITPWQLQ